MFYVQALLESGKGLKLKYLFLPSLSRYFRAMIVKHSSPEADLVHHHLVELAPFLRASHPLVIPAPAFCISGLPSQPYPYAVARKVI